MDFPLQPLTFQPHLILARALSCGFSSTSTAGVAQASMTGHSNDPSPEQVASLKARVWFSHEESWTTAVLRSDIIFSVDPSSSMSDDTGTVCAIRDLHHQSLQLHHDWQVTVVNRPWETTRHPHREHPWLCRDLLQRLNRRSIFSSPRLLPTAGPTAWRNSSSAMKQAAQAPSAHCYASYECEQSPNPSI